MASSSIPTYINGALALIRARPSLATVQILDGPPTTELADDYIAVGLSEGGEAVSGYQSPNALGNQRRSEEYAINCQVSSIDGDADMAVARARCFVLFAEVEAAIRADGTGSGAVMFADIGATNYSQEQDETGANATLNFTLSVRLSRI